MSFTELVAIILFAGSLICCSISLHICSRIDRDNFCEGGEKQLVMLSKNAGVYWIFGLVLLSLSAVLAG